MRDMLAHLKKLRAQIADCERFQKAAKSKIKRDIFRRLATHYRGLARELEAAIAAASEPIPDAFRDRKTREPFSRQDEEQGPL
jgi:hypothetical protein